VRALVRLILCLIVGAASGLLGGAVGLAVAGSSVQHTAAGSAKVTVKVGRPAGLTVINVSPAAVLSLSPWTVPLTIDVTAIDTDPSALVRAIADSGARTTLERQALDALVRAARQAALAALIGALVVGLLGGIAVSTLTRARRHTLFVALIAVLAAAAPVAIAVEQVATVGTSALASPRCAVVPTVSLAEAEQAARSPESDPVVSRSVAIQAACSPSFQAAVAQALSG